jgi:hypothetical protein
MSKNTTTTNNRAEIPGWKWNRSDREAKRYRRRAIRTARQFEHRDGRHVIHRRGDRNAWVIAEETEAVER